MNYQTIFFDMAHFIMDEMLAHGIHYPLSKDDQRKEWQRVSESLALLQPVRGESAYWMWV